MADVFGVSVSVRDVFDAPTVEELADLVTTRDRGLAPIEAVSPRPSEIPLSFAQSRMWFINQFEPGTATYNIPALLRLRGKLDLVALRRAVEDVVARHEVLRTTFPAVDGTPVQVIHPAHRVAAELDWAVVSDEQALADAVSTGFNVTESLPLRVRVAPVGPDEHIVALVAHHIAADGESMRPLVADLVTAYLARSADAAPEFVPLAVQFADYSIWQHQVLGDPADPESVVGRQLAHWVAELAGLPDVIDLPTDRPRPRIATHRGARMQVAIPAEIADRIAATAAERGVTSFMVVHAALSVLLARLSGSADIAVATPVAGRGHAVLDPLVGMFVNTLILRSEVDLAESFVDLLDRIRVTDLDAFTHADVPFETIVDALDPVRSEAFAPLAQVMLSMEAGAVEDPTVRVDELEVEPVEVPSVPAQLDLALTVTTAPSGDDWQCSIVYATDLFDDGTISTFADRYLALLAGLTSAPADAVGDTTLISPAETAAVLSAATGPTTEPIVETVADAVAAQVVRSPGAPALWCEGRVVSYAEFGARVAVLARELIGVGV
ncbi:condensation domain-containing protein, partial [Gordonia sputi]